ncbi:MAG: hypothetical protein AAGI71_16545 [Bacteroidota bacterium]
MPALGVLTTLGPSPHCYVQAQILGHCLRRLYPTVPRAVVGAPPCIAGLEASGWTLCPSDDPDLRRGFESKLCLWRHTPFDTTLFLDVDVVPYVRAGTLEARLAPLLNASAPVAFCAQHLVHEGDYQGTLMPDLRQRGIDSLHAARAGGHYLWHRGPTSTAVFREAQRIADARWPEVLRYRPALTNQWHTPDEVVVSIALARLYPDATLPDAPLVVTPADPRPRRQAATFVHFVADGAALQYAWTARHSGTPWSLAFSATRTWGMHTLRKAVAHYRQGGRHRIRTSAHEQAVHSASPSAVDPLLSTTEHI